MAPAEILQPLVEIDAFKAANCPEPRRAIALDGLARCMATKTAPAIWAALADHVGSACHLGAFPKMLFARRLFERAMALTV